MEFLSYLQSLPDSPVTDAVTAIYEAICLESNSDRRIFRIATELVDKFLTKETVKEIMDKFEDMESLSVFGTDDDFKITKEFHEPVHVIITAKLGSCELKGKSNSYKAYTTYTDPPVITLFLSDCTGRFRESPYGSQHVSKRDLNNQELIEASWRVWREVLLHEVSHALDKILRGSTSYGRQTRKSLLLSSKDGTSSYSNDLLETNARIPQFGNMVARYMLVNRDYEFIEFDKAMKLFSQYIRNISSMNDDTKKRTYKRAYDMWARLKEVWASHKDEIHEIGDWEKYLTSDDEEATIRELLGDCADVYTMNGATLRFQHEDGDTYKAISGTHQYDIGTVATFNGALKYDPKNPQKLQVSKLVTPLGTVMDNMAIKVKKIVKLK